MTLILETISQTMRAHLTMQRDRLLQDLELRYSHHFEELVRQRQQIAESFMHQYELQFDHIDLVLATQTSILSMPSQQDLPLPTLSVSDVSPKPRRGRRRRRKSQPSTVKTETKKTSPEPLSAQGADSESDHDSDAEEQDGVVLTDDWKGTA